MLYPLAGILFPTLARETYEHCACKCIACMRSNVIDTEFCLLITLGNQTDMACLTFLRVNHICFVLKSLV